MKVRERLEADQLLTAIHNGYSPTLTISDLPLSIP